MVDHHALYSENYRKLTNYSELSSKYWNVADVTDVDIRITIQHISLRFGTTSKIDIDADDPCWKK